MTTVRRDCQALRKGDGEGGWRDMNQKYGGLVKPDVVDALSVWAWVCGRSREPWRGHVGLEVTWALGEVTWACGLHPAPFTVPLSPSALHPPPSTVLHSIASTSLVCAALRLRTQRGGSSRQIRRTGTPL